MLLKTLAIASLCSLFVLIFIGGYVSASGVGLTCPHWPLCPAGLVPTYDFIVEYFHRSVAATTALLVIVTMAFTLKYNTCKYHLSFYVESNDPQKNSFRGKCRQGF